MSNTDHDSGGTLGFHCAHKYAHTREGMDKLMPFALKGIDMVLLIVFRSLGLKTYVRPLLHSSGQRHFDGRSYGDAIVGDGFHELQLGNVGGYDDGDGEIAYVSQALNGLLSRRSIGTNDLHSFWLENGPGLSLTM